MKRARGITVSPGADSRDVVVVLVSHSRAPGSGVPVDGGAAGVGDAHEVEREGARRSSGWPVVGQTASTGQRINR